MLEPPTLLLPPRLTLANPGAVLRSISQTPWFHLNIDTLETVELWALVALCALSRKERPDDLRCDIYHRGGSLPGRFAYAVGFDAARDGLTSFPKNVEPARTVQIHRVAFGQSAAQSAKILAHMAIPDPAEDESRAALAYVLDELLRNVLQHSRDALGAVVGAQRMDAGKGGYSRPTVQLAVADTGRGILESLRGSHAVSDPVEALEKSLRPHVSGTFPEGQRGGADNAGLGLFFTSEIAKLTAGRFLLATHGGALFLETNEDDNTHHLSVLNPPGSGFPGTLAVFELPLEVRDWDDLVTVIRERAQERAPAPTTRRWLTFSSPPAETKSFVVRDASDTADGVPRLSDELRRLVASSTPIALDFAGLRFATQSFLHGLLFQPLRVAWALGVPIYILGAEPAVRSGLLYLESYAL